jgi:hypothetical protein
MTALAIRDPAETYKTNLKKFHLCRSDEPLTLGSSVFKDTRFTIAPEKANSPLTPKSGFYNSRIFPVNLLKHLPTVVEVVEVELSREVVDKQKLISKIQEIDQNFQFNNYSFCTYPSEVKIGVVCYDSGHATYLKTLLSTFRGFFRLNFSVLQKAQISKDMFTGDPESAGTAERYLTPTATSTAPGAEGSFATPSQKKRRDDTR